VSFRLPRFDMLAEDFFNDPALLYGVYALPSSFLSSFGAIIVRMMLIVGGFSGSGKRYVVRAFAEKYGFYQYPIREKMLRMFVKDRRGLMREQVLQPKDNNEQLRIYERIASEFPRLTKMYPHVLVTDTFHKAAPRNFLLGEARKYFDNTAFVWIHSDEQSTARRMLARNPSAQPSIEEKLRTKKVQEQEFEAFDADVLKIDYKDSLAETVAELRSVIGTAFT